MSWFDLFIYLVTATPSSIPDIIPKKEYFLIKIWTDSWVVISDIVSKITEAIIIPRAGSNL